MDRPSSSSPCRKSRATRGSVTRRRLPRLPGMTEPANTAFGRPATIAFGPQVCGSLDEGASREWLVPDGLGGFAMGTVGGLRTRRYHGLLVVATEPPLGRRLGLVSLDPVLVLPGGARVPLGVHEWSSGDVAPRGHELLESF